MIETRPNDQWLDELLSLEPEPLRDAGFSTAVLAGIGRQSRKREIILWSIGLVVASITFFLLPANIMNYLPFEYVSEAFTVNPSSSANEIMVLLFSVFSILGLGWLFSEAL